MSLDHLIRFTSDVISRIRPVLECPNRHFTTSRSIERFRS